MSTPRVAHTLALALVAAGLLLSAAPAAAFGLEWGIRGGIGSAVWADSAIEPDASPFTVGPALRLGLGVISVEADALWHRTTWQVQGTDTAVDRFALPVLAKAEFPLVPGLISFGVGAGLEPRWLLSAEAGGQDVSGSFADQTLFLPVAAGLDLDLQVATANVEVRYAHQLEPEAAVGDTRKHELMVMFGLFF